MAKGKETVNFVRAKDFYARNVRIESDFKKPSENSLAPGCAIQYKYGDSWGPLNIRTSKVPCGGVNNNSDWLKKNNSDGSPKYDLSINLGREGQTVSDEVKHLRKELTKLDALIANFIALHCESFVFEKKGMLSGSAPVMNAIKKAKSKKLSGDERTQLIADALDYKGLVQEYTPEQGKYAGQTQYSLKMKVGFEAFEGDDANGTPRLAIFSHKDRTHELDKANIDMLRFTEMFYWGADLSLLFRINRFMVVGAKSIYIQLTPCQVIEPKPKENLSKNPVWSDDEGDDDDNDNEGDEDDEGESTPPPKNSKKSNVQTEDSDEENDGENDDDNDEDDEDDEPAPPPKKTTKGGKKAKQPEPEPESEEDEEDEENDDDDEEDEPAPPPKKVTKGAKGGKKVKEPEPEPELEPESEDDEEEIPVKKGRGKGKNKK